MGTGSVTVVYIDLLFGLNFTANYLLLLGAGRMAGTVLHRLRIAAGAALGAVYAAAAFFPGFEWLTAWPCKAGAGVLMVLAAFGGGRKLLRTCVLFFGASAALAGGVLAVQLLGGIPLTAPNGIFYTQTDLRLLLLLFVLCYFVLSFFFRRVGVHGSRELTPVRIRLLGQVFSLTALVDSGHCVTDPVTNRPVLIADGACLSGCLPSGVSARKPIESVRRCQELGLRGARLIPYRAVGVECGLLLALPAEQVRIGGKTQDGLLVALSPTPLDDGGGYQVLVGVSG